MVFYGTVMVFAMRSCFDFAKLPPTYSTVNTTLVNDEVDFSYINQTNITQTNSPNAKYYWSSKTRNLILSAFIWGFLCTLVAGGRISEIYGSKWPYGLSILATAIFTLITPFVTKLNPLCLIAIRFFQGCFEGITIPSSFTLMTKWIPPLEGNVVFAIACFGIDFGLFLPRVLSTLVYDWDLVFYIIGCGSILWFLLMTLLVFDSPYDHPRISREEKQYIIGTLNGAVDGRNLKGIPVPWFRMLSSLPFWALMTARFAYSWGTCIFQKFLPNLLLEYHNYNVQSDIDWYLLPYIGDITMGLLVAILMDFSRTQNYCSNTFVRKLCTITGGLIPAVCCVVIANFMGFRNTVAVCYIVAIATSAFSDSGCLLNEVDLSPRFAGTLYGIGYAVSQIADVCAFQLASYILSVQVINLVSLIK